MESTPLTYRELKEAVNNLTEDQLSEFVRWSGEDRGGTILSVNPMDDDMYNTDEGYTPRHSMNDQEFEDYVPDKEDMIPKGTLILWVD